MDTFQVQVCKAKVQHRKCSKLPKDDTDGTGGVKLPPFTLQPSREVGDSGYYGVRIITGKVGGAGVNNLKIYLRLIGNKACTGKLYIEDLKQFFEDGLKPDTHMDMMIATDDSLGDIQVVVLGIDGMLADLHTWFVDFTVVYDFLKSNDADREIQFPCYHWISGDGYVTTTAHTTTLKDVQGNEVLLNERTNQLTKRKQQYKWQFFPKGGLPSAIDDTLSDLPLDEEFSRVKDIDFYGGFGKAFISTEVAGALVTVDNLHDYIDLAKFLDEQELKVYLCGRWATDVEFGREMLNGVNPVVIKKCTSLPKNFPVTNDMVQPFLTRGKNLAQEMKAGHVYICDLKIFEGLPPRKGQSSCAPICLLYVNSSKQLVPIAIQLKQQPGKDNPIFLPSDRLMDWLLAKIYYQSAHGQFHQLSTHYMSCHAAMEAYGVATMRNLPDAHPIYKLLYPHFRYTMSINCAARLMLVNPGGIIDQIFGIGGEGKVEFFQKVYKEYNVDWTNIEKNVAERGVDNADQLPGYYYRDDGLKIFRAIKGFVTDVVENFYPGKAAKANDLVKKDTELQAWADDIHTNAFPASGGVQGHGFPKKINTRDELIERCTVIIFTGSVQHSSVNFGQYAYYGYVPNSPLTVREDPPTGKGNDYQQLLDSLPDKGTAKSTMNLTYTLSQYSQDEVFLGNYPDERFTETNVQRYIERMQKRLEEISGEIKVRNKDLDVPYTYMLPKRVTNSITI